MKHLFFFLLPLITSCAVSAQNWRPCDPAIEKSFTLSSPDGEYYLECLTRQVAEPVEYLLILHSSSKPDTLTASMTSVYDDGGPVMFWTPDSRFLLIDSDDPKLGRQTRWIDLREFRVASAASGYLRSIDTIRNIAFLQQYTVDETSGRAVYSLYRFYPEDAQVDILLRMQRSWDFFESPEIQPDPGSRMLRFRFSDYINNKSYEQLIAY